MKMTEEEIKKKYTQIFYDDFEGNELDITKWERCPEWERQEQMKNHGWWNDGCSYVKDGNLILECKQESDGRLISGAVRSISKDGSKIMFKAAKGLYEIKFKVDKGSGFWYAFWLFADNDESHVSGSAQNAAELDFFEILPGNSPWKYNGVNGNEPGRLMTTIHWDAYGAAHKMKGTDGIKVTDKDNNFYDNWHIYQFEWNDYNYKCYLDGNLLWVMSGKDYGNGICEAPGYMKISAEFGEWGGPVDSVIQAGGSRKMYVDYVKVYKKRISD